MYKGIHDDKHRMLVANLIEVESKLKWAQSGYHEKYILCKNCESLLSKLERYIANILYGTNLDKSITIEKTISKDGVRSIFIKNIEYDTFKLCFLSILWSAHISQISFFKKMKIIDHEKAIREMILSKNGLEENDFKLGIIGVQKYDDSLINVVLDPEVISVENGKVAIFFINGFFYFIELNPHSGFKIFNKCYLKKEGEIEIPLLRGQIAKDFLLSFGLPNDIVSHFVGL